MALYIEEGTNYAYLIKALPTPTFSTIRKISKDFIIRLPPEDCDQLHADLEHGVCLLENEATMSMYMYAYGNMHYAKLMRAFSHLNGVIDVESDIEIIDYGCGQAIGSMTFIEYCLQNDIGISRIKQVTLIEPSMTTLKRGAMHIRKFVPDVEIVTVNKSLNDLAQDDIKTSEDLLKIHIFSNILDIEEIDIQRIAEYTSEKFNGHNLFVCVGPYYGTSFRSGQIPTFCSFFTEIFGGENICAENLDKEHFNGWTCQLQLFHYKHYSSPGRNLFSQLLESAKSGDLNAQRKVGLGYCSGQVVKQNYPKALYWFYEVAKQKGVNKVIVEKIRWIASKDADAQFLLGKCYSEGQGVATNLEEAVNWYRKAAEQGNAKAQYSLGDCYEYGYGVTKNETEAANWYRKAAEQGNAKAQNNLGACYGRGYGVTKNEAEAVNWYRKAAEQGNATAQYNLGTYYRQGRGVTKNEAEAVNWYRKAAEQGNATAQNNLGACYGRGYGVSKNETEAANWYRKAAEQGNAKAQYNLGVCYRNGIGIERDLKDAAKWFCRAAIQGYDEAKQALNELEQG